MTATLLPESSLNSTANLIYGNFSHSQLVGIISGLRRNDPDFSTVVTAAAQRIDWMANRCAALEAELATLKASHAK